MIYSLSQIHNFILKGRFTFWCGDYNICLGNMYYFYLFFSNLT